jgi:hypothetical protein
MLLPTRMVLRYDVKLAPRIIRRALAQRHLEDLKFSLRGVVNHQRT